MPYHGLQIHHKFLPVSKPTKIAMAKARTGTTMYALFQNLTTTSLLDSFFAASSFIG